MMDILQISFYNSSDIEKIHYKAGVLGKVCIFGEIKEGEKKLKEDIKQLNDLDIPVRSVLVYKKSIAAWVTEELRIILSSLPLHENVAVIVGNDTFTAVERPEVVTEYIQGRPIHKVTILIPYLKMVYGESYDNETLTAII